MLSQQDDIILIDGALVGKFRHSLLPSPSLSNKTDTLQPLTVHHANGNRKKQIEES